MSNKKTTLAKLRFPEFKNDPEWHKIPLAKVLKEHKMKSDRKCTVHSVSVSKGVVNQIEHLGRSYAASDTSNYNLVKPFDIIYTKSPTKDFPLGIVKQSLKDCNVIVSPLYGVFTPLNKYIGYIIDAYFESSHRANAFLDPITQKGAKNTINISNKTFLSGKLYLPKSESEQQKVADCLSSIDEVINLEEQKLDALQEHKKGLLQNLFPAEGETLPKLRFPEFKNDPEWETKKLKYLATFSQGIQIDLSEHKKSYEENYVPFLRIENYTKNSSDLRYVPKKYASGKIVFKDDIVVVRYGAYYVCRGREGVLANNLFKVEPNSEISKDFLYLVLNSEKTNHFIQNAMVGGAMPAINFGLIGNIEIALPQKEEQEKIAECLFLIDEVINLEEQKLDALQEHKKGLMQQLFPTIKEIQ